MKELPKLDARAPNLEFRGVPSRDSQVETFFEEQRRRFYPFFIDFEWEQ